MMNHKKYYLLFLLLTGLICMNTGCASKEDVSLTMWIQDEDYDSVYQAVEKFKEDHAKEANLSINLRTEAIESMKGVVLSNPEAAADIYHFADDQFLDLKDNNALLPITVDKEEVIHNCGGTDALVIQTISDGDDIYAYPTTASNGYFLYYNKDYYTEEDVKQLDTILDIAAKNNKVFAMDWSSGWYLYSFFGGAGMTITADPDSEHNICDFNRTDGDYTGVDVANAMLDISSNPGFSNVVSTQLLNRVTEGNVIAMVSGTWYANTFEHLWGDKLGACKLPTYTLKGDQVQMTSFAGFKYYGVNPHSQHTEWAQKLASYLTNYDNQLTRYRTVGECPANVYAVATDEVQRSEAITALNDQNRYAIIQHVYENYWDPMASFGSYLAAGNPDNRDLQDLLDETVSAITNNE